jgi:hypothetical protein
MVITIVICGGMVHSTYAPPGMEIEIIDFDNPSHSTEEPAGEECPQATINEIKEKIRVEEQNE